MTREQAEIVLHSIKFILDNAQYSDDVEEALNIAIEELKNSERTEKSSQNVSNDDSISRKAAIDAICTEGTRLERNGTVAMAEIKQWCVDILEALPSAQPEVIRCKDCIYQVESWIGMKYCEVNGDHIGVDYDYCSTARRKENG